MKKFVCSVQALALAGLSAPALAHGGHDHAHWSADYVHIMLYAAIAIAAAGVVYAAYTFTGKSIKANKQEKNHVANRAE